MEENQRNQDTINEIEVNRYGCHHHHPLWKCILCGLLTFLGSFCAFYTLADWHYKSMLRRNMFPDQMERAMRHEMRAIDQMFAEEGKLSKKAGNIIHLKQTKDFYKVAIDLRAFDNNENNVQVTTNGNILTINGRSIRKSKNNEQISEFQQQYMFGSNVKLSDISKTTEGNYLIVTIPINHDED